MADANQPLGGTAIKPVGWDRTGWEAFKYMLFDPDNGTILTRTPLSWLKITVFYVLYYTFLACFWIACLVVFFQTLPEEESGPKWQQDWGLIGKNPGVGLRPRNTDERIDSQMFVLKKGDTNIHPSDLDGEGDLNADYAVRVSKFFKMYEKTLAPAVPGPDPAKPLFKGYQKFDTTTLGSCGDFPYGYVGEEVKPCIFFKLNNIWGWEPKPVQCGDPEQNAEDGEPFDACPDTLTTHLESPAAKEAKGESIWIDCNGRNPADKEAVEGDRLAYFPASRSIPISYFPYLGQRNQNQGPEEDIGYHSPLVAIQVEPKLMGQLVHMECRAYYRGVKHDKKDKLGLVQFEVQVL